MKRFIAALCALAAFAYPAAVLADSFTIGNITNQTLHFNLRCADGDDTWHAFTLQSLQSREYASGKWDYDCSAERYELRIGTKNDDGSTNWETIPIAVGSSYALVNSPKHSGFIAYDTRYMVAFRNDSSVTVKVNYKCTDGANSQGIADVSTSEVGWIWAQNCNAYNVMTRVVNKDGTTTELSRNVDANTIYKIVWNADREGYEFQKL